MQPGEAKASKARAAVVGILVGKFVGIFTVFLQAFAGILRKFLQGKLWAFLISIFAGILMAFLFEFLELYCGQFL